MTIKSFFFILAAFIIMRGLLGFYGMGLPDLRGGHSLNPKLDILLGIGIILVTLIISKLRKKT